MPAPRAFLLPLFALAAVVAGCPTDPARPPRDPVVPEDEWSRISPSKEWLYATGDFSGPHQAECDHVLAWVKGEEVCKASLCEHGRDLASEWLTRCAGLEPRALAATADAVKQKLTERATQPATDCGEKLELIVRDGCGEDKTCLATGQRWATRCGKNEGTPLVMRILQKVLERRQEQGADPVSLDPRTCDELAADVREAAKCKDRFVCADASARVQTYRDRCESASDRPSIATAVAELVVLVGGGKPAESIVVRQGSPALGPADSPVTLADGSGGVVSVCEERASDLARYVGARRGCQAGKMVVARAFQTARGVEVKVGALEFPDEATFSARYPTILAAGEAEQRDREEAAALGAELDKAAGLARSAGGVAEAARTLTGAVILHAAAIHRSAAARAVLTQHDALLAPALREIGKQKAAASRGFKVPPADAAGVLARARTRAFADLGPDGAVNIGARTRALTLDTTALLPRAMDDYLAALKSARPRKLDARTAASEKARGLAAATACGADEKKLQESKKSLLSCNFGLETCDAGRQAALAKSVDEARAGAESAFHDLETARTADAADADTLDRAAAGAACREPWW